MAREKAVAVEPPTIDAARMWSEYVRARQPVVLDGLLDDDAWKGASWDLDTLKAHAGDAVIMVEPVHPTEGVFGTATPRVKMTFAEYIDKLRDPAQRGKYYLTTQYDLDEEEEQEDEDAGPVLDPLFPSPTHKLRGEFPAHPRILGELVLQQCNLWLGNSAAGTTSGLHHDFHDNLYLLLRGQKRFVLFPPSAHAHLHVRGDVTAVHKNGLIVYGDGDIRADGLTELDAAHWRVAARAHALHNPSAKRPKGRESVREAYEKAKATYREMARGEEDEEEGEEEEPEEPGEVGEDWDDEDGAGVDGEDILLALESQERREPDSFSLIKPHVLHAHFGLEQASGAHKGESPGPGEGCPAPLVVELRAGQMLYLPASWFHEVTSTADDTAHIAFNYWMHPPDGTEHAYTDTEVWDAHRRAVNNALEQ